MHSLNMNKYFGAILVAVLLTVVISKLGSIVYHVDSPDEMSYIVELEPVEGDDVDEAPAMTFDQVLAMADPTGGQNIAKKCASCHTFEEGDTATKQGPTLWNIVDRDVGGVAGFSYSSAMADLGGIWTYDRLNEFIAGPRAFVPGTKMTYAGIGDMEERAQLVAWLRTLSADPVPLPDVEMDVEGTQVDGDDVGTVDSEGDLIDTINEGIDDISDDASDAADAASDAVEDAADSTSDAVEDAADSASDAVDDAADSASDAVDSVTGDSDSNN